MRQLHLFIVGEKTLPRAGVPLSSLLSCRLGFSGLDGAADSSGGARREAAIDSSGGARKEAAGGDAGLAVAMQGKGVEGGWRLGWCGSPVAEATGGPICDSCSGEGLVQRRRPAALPDFGESGLEAGVEALRHRR